MNNEAALQSIPEPPTEIVERVAANLADIQRRIKEAIVRSEFGAASARLVAVTKYASDDEVAALYKAGHRTFGESRIQDAVPRIERFPADCEWNLIGHLQRNKAKQAVRPFVLIHSVDSERLIRKLAEEIKKDEAVKSLRILLQVNVSGEESKFGCDPGELKKLLELCRDSAAGKIHAIGLMTIAPQVESSEAARPFFRKLRELLSDMNEAGFPLTELSMGMSGDFEVALEEGATLVRVGSALFA